MAEKGGTKILAIITICVMLVTIGFSGCIGDDGDEIIVDYLPPIAKAGENQTVFVNETVFFNASDSCCGYGYLNITWDFDDRNGIQVDSKDIKPKFVYKYPGNYTVTLIVYNPPKDGRIDTDTVIITVIPLTDN